MKFEANKIYNENCLDTMARMPDNFIDLIVTSPPYNKGYWSSNRNLKNGFKTKSRRIEYDSYNDCVEPDEYIKTQKAIITECLRVLKPTGSLFYNHQPIQKNHLEINPTYIYDFPLKQTIIWNRKNTPKLDKSYFFPTIEQIYWIKKEPNSRVKFDRKKAIFNKVIWDINPDKKSEFPAPFPEELVNNCILSCTDEGDLVYDPFMGSGTTAIASKKLNRDYIGSELGYTKDIELRLKECIENEI